MHKIFKIAIFLMFIKYQAFSQTIVAYNISPLSASVNSNYKIDYTIGLNVQQTDNKIFFNSNIFSFFNKNSQNDYNSDIFNNLIVECFPNPATDYVNIIVSSKLKFSTIKINLYNSNAQKQQCSWNYSKNNNFYKIFIDLQNQNPNTYIIEVIFDNKFQKTIKIIKN